MTWSDAAATVTVQNAERHIVDDPSMSLWGKVQAHKTIQNAAAAQPPEQEGLTVTDIAHGAIGAGLGYGAGTVLGKFLAVEPSMLQTMQTLGMGLGTIFNMSKRAMDHDIEERDARNAFRYGFVKAVLDMGLLEKSAGFVTALPLGPDILTAPINAALGLGTSAASNLGALGGAATAPDSTDERMAKMQLEQRALESQAGELQSQRSSAILRKILDKRLGKR